MIDDELAMLRSDIGADRLDRLARVISATAGMPPRPLPSRLALALERTAPRIAILACAVAVLCSGGRALVGRNAPPTQPVILQAMNGEMPKASDVYAWVNGLDDIEGNGR